MSLSYFPNSWSDDGITSLLHNNRSSLLKAFLYFRGSHRISIINVPLVSQKLGKFRRETRPRYED